MNTDLNEVENFRLNVDYYGADFPVDLLVRRMNEEDFIIPGFQREYVWNGDESSRFIESLLIGLPTPALFLAKDKFSNKYIVIDGQQRLRTLQYFYEGSFPDGKPFTLKKVAPQLASLGYSTLSPSDRRALDNAIIHCIIISDNYDPNGMFHLFERLNTTGSPLTHQEVRNAIYHGSFSDLLQRLSNDQTWLTLYRTKDNRGEGQELILRFFALHYELEHYTRSFVDFQNFFMLSHKDIEPERQHEMETLFLNTINFLKECIGVNVFYPKKHQFLKGFFDCLMLFTSRKSAQELDCDTFRKVYDSLVHDDSFWALIRQVPSSRKKAIERLTYVEAAYENILK